MSSLAQVEANRRNSLLSTGPGSHTGKCASRMNAVKSGLYARCLVISGEDPAEYEALAANYQEQYQPVTPTEQYLVDRLISDDWRLRRYIKADRRPESKYEPKINLALRL